MLVLRDFPPSLTGTALHCTPFFRAAPYIRNLIQLIAQLHHRIPHQPWIQTHSPPNTMLRPRPAIEPHDEIMADMMFRVFIRDRIGFGELGLRGGG
jgi:hypothetical protein